MRYMGLDLGNRTVGIAFSDPMGIVATGYETYRFNEKDLQKVLEYVKILVVEKNVDKIVLGLPKNMDGSLGFKAKECTELAEKINQGFSGEVVMWDERCTTVSAHHALNATNTRGKKRKAVVDAVAATMILEDYLRSIK